MLQAKIAVIADLVDSRNMAGRSSMQIEIERSFALVNERTTHDQPLEPTIGDEFQAVYSTLTEALQATMLARLSLPEGVDCRFGIGFGAVVTIGEGAVGALQDGSAWWLAREAIDEAHRRQDSRTPTVRSWYRSDPLVGARQAQVWPESLVNAYLISRDHLIGSMGSRGRRLAFGSMLGRTQQELARQEEVSQSAVSQSLRRSGGASLIATFDLLQRGEL